VTPVCVGISDAGAAELANALRDNCTLVQVGLSSNSIGNKGAKELADVLNMNYALETLYLEENDVDEDGEGAVALRKVLKNTFKIKWFDPTSQIAFAMGLHERLGVRSYVHLLDQHLVQEILRYTHDRVRRDIQFYPRS